MLAPAFEKPGEDSMLYGIAPVAEALRQGRRELRRLYSKEGKASPRLKIVLQEARRQGVPVEERSAHDLASMAGSRLHQGAVLDCGELPLLDLDDFLEDAGPRSLVVALDQVEDPQNLGGIARSAAFLGADALILHRANRAPLSPAASKASAGALEFFPVIEVPNLSNALQALQKENFFVYGAALEDAIDYREVDRADRAVLVLGSEGEGLRSLTRKRCDQLVFIPRRGQEMESLNVNVAAGILLARFGGA
jgi:23S rRNA (guanosine2251-2'-O)-methyltransferase